MEESIRYYDSLIVMLRARVAFLFSWDNNVAAQSSNLGIVRRFSGAIFNLEHKSSQNILLSVERLQTGSIGSLTVSQ
jgi:hypothetical protein